MDLTNQCTAGLTDQEDIWKEEKIQQDMNFYEIPQTLTLDDVVWRRNMKI